MFKVNETLKDDAVSESGEQQIDVYALEEAYRILQWFKMPVLYGGETKFILPSSGWSLTPSYNILCRSIRHCDESIRLHALSLIVRSKRTTEHFGMFEVELMRDFLTYNIGEEMEYLPLTTKALKRMSSSWAVLKRDFAKEECRRNHVRIVAASEESIKESTELSYKVSDSIHKLKLAYSTFLSYLYGLCIDNLYIGATYSRRRSCLRILHLLHEMFESELSTYSRVEEEVKCVFGCLLTDTYASNKEIAYKILKLHAPHTLGLNENEKVTEIIDVAIGLANSIRPIDSITALFMFKFVALSPVMKDVLSTYIDFNSYPNEVNDDVELQLIIFLMEQLKEPMQLARENIVTTVGKHSLYGYLFCIKNLLDDRFLGEIRTSNSRRLVIGELITMCFELNDIVSQIVNNSSPEGHLPMDLNPQNLRASLHESETTMVTPQMVLLCSWRTVKEVSLLFGNLTEKSSISDNDNPEGLLTEQQVFDIGRHLVSLLCETKHRGAFEQAYVGFAQLSHRLWRHKRPSLNLLPKIWLHNVLLAIAGFTDGNSKLCATRRSAGVPYMILAIASMEPRTLGETEITALQSVMRILLGFANLKDDIDLTKTVKSLLYKNTAFSELKGTSSDLTIPFTDIKDLQENEKLDRITEIKTHALNILRLFFRHSLFGDLIASYIADGMITAIENYDGKSWAERNAATLLFGALIVRIFGVQRTKDYTNLTKHNRMMGKLFFEKYPSLLPFVINRLRDFESADDAVIRPSIQSILLLLSRLYTTNVPAEVDFSWELHEFIRLVSSCAKSRIYKTRELAARALVSLMTREHVQFVVVRLYLTIAGSLVNRLSFNAIHGYMLQLLEITKVAEFKESLFNETQLCDLINRTSWILTNLENTNDRAACFPLATTCVNFFIEFSNLDDTCTMGRVIRDVAYDQLEKHLTQGNVLKQRPGRELYEMTVAKFIVSMNKEIFHTKESLAWGKRYVVTWRLILSHSNPLVQIVGWSEAIEHIRRNLFCTLRKMVLDETIAIMLERVSLPMEDPEVKDSVYEFIYVALTNFNRDNCYKLEDDNRFYCLLLTELLNSMKRSDFNVTANFLKLLGKAFFTLSRCHEIQVIEMKCKQDIYETFLNNSWMCSSDVDLRFAVCEVLLDLFIDPWIQDAVDIDTNNALLNWWTTLLNLLVDDDAKIRRKASLIVSKISPRSNLECHDRMLVIFFEKFVKTVGPNYPELVFAALFVWSVAWLNNSDYEMDESDVFSKCRNYSRFEPSHLAALCTENLKLIIDRHSVDRVLPSDIKHWLRTQLDLPALDFKSFRDLVTKYKEHVPTLTKKLNDVLDPVYSDKLQKASAYEKLESLVSTKCHGNV